MSGAPWTAAAELFADLLELPEQDRTRTLEERTTGEPGLRSAVERLSKPQARRIGTNTLGS